jgi:hypothetical protein
MQKKPSITIQQKYSQLKSDLKLWSTVEKDGWYIKFSILRDECVLLIFVSSETSQTIIRYFGNEDEAVKYINFICNKDPGVMLQGDENPA